MFCCKHSESIYGEPKHVHIVRAKQVIKGTLDYSHRDASNGKIKLHGFTDSYWEGSAKDKKSTSRCCFSLGSSMISWFNREHTSTVLSTA